MARYKIRIEVLEDDDEDQEIAGPVVVHEYRSDYLSSILSEVCNVAGEYESGGGLQAVAGMLADYCCSGTHTDESSAEFQPMFEAACVCHNAHLEHMRTVREKKITQA